MQRLALAFVVVAGCGDNIPVEMPDAKPDAPGPFSTAPHTALPQVVKHANVVLDHPKLVTLVYSDYVFKTQVKAWGDAVVGSSWWPAVAAEYGIGTMTHEATFEMGPAPTTTTEDTDLETKIDGLITAGSIPAPPATGSEYLYMIYVPSTVPLGDSLTGFYGYHYDLVHAASGARYAYAVIIDDGTGIDTTTTTAAHELIEAATDPYSPQGMGGWYSDPPLPDPWWLILGEVADLCNFDPYHMEGGFAFQRSWSNAAAAAGMNPCVPNTGDVYESVSADPPMMPMVNKGDTVSFTLTGWSTLEEADWTLDTYDADYSDLTAAQIQPTLSAHTINNRKTVTLTFKVPNSAQSGDNAGVYVLSGEYGRPWPVGFTVK